MHFKGKDWRRFSGKKASPKVPEWASYGNFCKVTQNQHFLKTCKRGTKENFSKIAQQVAVVWKAQSTLAQMALSSNFFAFKVQTAAPKVPEWPSYGNFREVIQNPSFLKKCKGGNKRNFSNNRSKSKPRLKGRKALWRKWHYPCAHGIIL